MRTYFFTLNRYKTIAIIIITITIAAISSNIFWDICGEICGIEVVLESIEVVEVVLESIEVVEVVEEAVARGLYKNIPIIGSGGMMKEIVHADAFSIDFIFDHELFINSYAETFFKLHG